MTFTRLAAVLLLALAGCSPTSAPPEEKASAVMPPRQLPTAAAAAQPPLKSSDKVATASRLPSASRDPDVVLRAWADAVEGRDWPAVRAFWADHGARSGLSEQAFAAKWSGLQHPRVTLAKGEGEGAAGSLFYTAPVRITDGARLTSGEIVIRRVNDVDGASPEQLRWHIESTTLTP